MPEQFTSQIYVKPASEGLIVRQPHRHQEPLPAHGAAVPKNAYWLRRLRDGDVVETTQAAMARAAKQNAASDKNAE